MDKYRGREYSSRVPNHAIATRLSLAAPTIVDAISRTQALTPLRVIHFYEREALRALDGDGSISVYQDAVDGLVELGLVSDGALTVSGEAVLDAVGHRDSPSSMALGETRSVLNDGGWLQGSVTRSERGFYGAWCAKGPHQCAVWPFATETQAAAWVVARSGRGSFCPGLPSRLHPVDVERLDGIAARLKREAAA